MPVDPNEAPNGYKAKEYSFMEKSTTCEQCAAYVKKRGTCRFTRPMCGAFDRADATNVVFVKDENP